MSTREIALAFATGAHAGQKRKYTGEDYIQHPIRVAQLVAEAGLDEQAEIVALLHDTLEDTSVIVQDIVTIFDHAVAERVVALTNFPLSYGNRKLRVRVDAERLSLGDAVVHSIKCADTIDNAPSIIQYDPNFAKVFLAEKRALVPRLVRAEPTLLKRALEIIGGDK